MNSLITHVNLSLGQTEESKRTNQLAEAAQRYAEVTLFVERIKGRTRESILSQGLAVISETQLEDR